MAASTAKIDLFAEALRSRLPAASVREVHCSLLPCRTTCTKGQAAACAGSSLRICCVLAYSFPLAGHAHKLPACGRDNEGKGVTQEGVLSLP